jgi:Protein of unknown function (DUF1761)
MPLDQLNYLAILVAAGVAYGIGALWFSVLFAKPWMAAIGKKREELGSPAFALVANIFNLLLTAFVLSVIYHWYEPLRADWLVGFWVGFVFTTRLVGYLFEGQNLPLFLIDAAYFLVIYLAMGTIIGGWR